MKRTHKSLYLNQRWTVRTALIGKCMRVWVYSAPQWYTVQHRTVRDNLTSSSRQSSLLNSPKTARCPTAASEWLLTVATAEYGGGAMFSAADMLCYKEHHHTAAHSHHRPSCVCATIKHPPTFQRAFFRWSWVSPKFLLPLLPLENLCGKWHGLRILSVTESTAAKHWRQHRVSQLVRV